MADVLKNLSKQRHMELEQLQKQTNIPQKELEKLLGQYSKFFNMRPKLDGIQISLSPSGKKFFDHVMDSKIVLNKLIIVIIPVSWDCKSILFIIFKHTLFLFYRISNSYIC